jgi:hypothetical protein
MGRNSFWIVNYTTFISQSERPCTFILSLSTYFFLLAKSFKPGFVQTLIRLSTVSREPVGVPSRGRAFRSAAAFMEQPGQADRPPPLIAASWLPRRV